MANKQNLILFTAVTLLSGWIGVLVDREMGPQPEDETLGMLLWLVLPLLATILFRFIEKDWSGMGLRPAIRQNLNWYIVAVITFPLVTLSIVLLGYVLGWTEISRFNPAIYFNGFLVALLPNFLKNVFEEFVWRGYLTGRLLKTRLKDIWIYLIVGGIWGAWHIPYFLFFLPEPTINLVLPVHKVTFTLVSLMTMICWTVMYVELFRITKTIWPVVILHAIEDAVVNHLILDKHIVIHEKAILVSPIVGIITSLAYLAIGLLLRRKRKRLAFARAGSKRTPNRQVFLPLSR